MPDLNSWASEAARSSTLSGKLSPSASWLRAWKKDHSLQRLSGLAISPNSRQDDFAAWWMASLRDSPAKICQLRADAPASTASDPACSSTCSTSQTLAVRGSSFWRTSQASLLPPPPLWTKKKENSKSAPLPASWENWPTVGGMRNGSLFQRPMWAPATVAPAGSASHGDRWQTPKASEEESGSGLNSRGEPKLKGQANNWMTPHGMGGMDTTGKLGAGGEFAKQATNWPTPKTITGGANCNRAERGAGGPDLQESAQHWPTPTARDFKGSSAEGGLTRMDGKSRMDQLANAAVFSPLGQATPAGQESLPDSLGSPPPSQTKKLNSYFVEWLMGWRQGWTSPVEQPDCGPAATALYRSALQRQLSSLFADQGSSANGRV